MTSIIPAQDINALMLMSPSELNKTTAQMTALLSEMASEKGRIDSMVTMLEKQPWYKKCIFTITGKNKVTVSEINNHKDKLASYTSSALAQLYQNNKIEQQQIVALGEAINSVNGQLAATNYELIEAQVAVANLRSELIQSITGLSNALNEKIVSVDNFHMLTEEINQGVYDCGNVIASIFSVIAQIDRRMAADARKMNIIRNALVNKGYLNDEGLPLFQYMKMVAALPDKVAGTIYYEFFCLNGNGYACMFANLMECYVFLPRMEKKSKKVDMIIQGICDSNYEDSDTVFSTTEIYDYFLESKIDYLSSIREAKVNDAESIEQQPAESEKNEGTNQAAIPEEKSKPAVTSDSKEPQEKKNVENSDIRLRVTDITDKYIKKIVNHKSIARSYDSNEVKDINIIRTPKAKFGILAKGAIIGFIDTSFRQNGNDGFLFTTEGIAFIYASKTVFIRYREIDQIRFNKRKSELIFHPLNWFEDAGGFLELSINNLYINIDELGKLILEIKGTLSNSRVESGRATGFL